MTIHGINPGLGMLDMPPTPPRRERVEDAGHRGRVRDDEVTIGSPGSHSASGIGASPAEAPRGTDPALWSVLTSEERAFFARARESGPLMYGRGSDGGALAGARIGGRIDVKV
jgi:hypothetical protein